MIKEDFGKVAPLTRSTPNNSEITGALAKAVTHHLAGQSENALSDLDLALEGGSPTAEIFAARAYLQLELGRFEDAWKSYSKALELEPGDPQISFNCGIALQNLGRTEEAIPDLSAP